VIDTLTARVLLIIVLLIGQGGLGVWFGSVEDNAPMEHLMEDDMTTDNVDHLGREVIVTGTVVGTDPVRIRVSGPEDTVELIVDGLESSVSVDADVQIRGRLIEPQTVQVDEAIVVPKWGPWYAWTVSLLAGLWVLVRIGRQWHASVVTLSVRPRDRTETGVEERDG